MSHSILFITNGNKQIGFGHIARDKVIAGEFAKNKWNVNLLTLSDSPFINNIINQDFLKLHTVCSFQRTEAEIVLSEIINSENINVILIDLIEREYLDLFWIKDKFPKILIVTITLFLFDLSERYEHISFFPGIQTIENIKQNDLKLYSGISFFIFREEFKTLEKNIRKEANKILITMGGADPYSLTLKILENLDSTNLYITVILPKHSLSYNDVKRTIEYKSNIRLIEFTEDISKEMTEHDIAIINGGGTRYEVCLAKTPFIAVSIHEVQYNITKQLTDLGVGINLGIKDNLNMEIINRSVHSLLNNYTQRKIMSERMACLFDTDGASRIYNIINKALDEKND